MNESYEIFDWERYLLENNDLQIDVIMTRQDAWNHWINNGKQENREFFIKKNESLQIEKNIIKNLFDFINQEEKKMVFDWILYLCSNPDLYMNGIKNKTSALDHWLTLGKNENRSQYLENYNSMLRHEFLNFNWERYVKINGDLKYLNQESSGWNHWLYHGIKEERATYLINNSKIHNGRFGNLFFINMALHFLSMKYNLKFNYKYYNRFKK
jgi:hypothetical protein